MRGTPQPTHLYVQVIGHHAGQPERLLIRSDDGRWYVWFGDRTGTPLREINEPIADWLQGQPDLMLLPEPHFWMHVDDLPVSDNPSQDGGSTGELTS